MLNSECFIAKVPDISYGFITELMAEIKKILTGTVIRIIFYVQPQAQQRTNLRQYIYVPTRLFKDRRLLTDASLLNNHCDETLVKPSTVYDWQAPVKLTPF